MGPHTCWCDSPWTPRPLTVKISSPGQNSISSPSPPLQFVIWPPSSRLPRRAAWPPGKIDLTKMPMLPRGLSRPPTTLGKNKFRGNSCETIFYLNPSPLLPCPLWNTAVWTVICKLRRASSPLRAQDDHGDQGDQIYREERSLLIKLGLMMWILTST